MISGLAYGIDAIAHKAAIKNNLLTVGVLAHGLDQVYPPQHTGLAKEMVNAQWRFTYGIQEQNKPDKHNFPARNRIVAGMSDATIVVETGIKGGSMITAELANNYNKDVFAFPGKVTDTKSAVAITYQKQQGHLLTDAQELLELMDWERKAAKSRKKRVNENYLLN